MLLYGLDGLDWVGKSLVGSYFFTSPNCYGKMISNKYGSVFVMFKIFKAWHLPSSKFHLQKLCIYQQKLVGGIPTPLKHMSSSNGIIVPMGKDVPKHQPGNGNHREYRDLASSKLGGQLINCCCFMLFKKVGDSKDQHSRPLQSFFKKLAGRRSVMGIKIE